ncbi:peptidylprolyl isomerase [Janibacter alkaliphilus]|uniref:Peptidyl-prolyl cis-trans isomerase n=1 Tax=Janibacter alkaliphilus TaxID=1069963 RepID=A0A852X0X2_9MICO|nr:peptidylprolyl isomerase [Janibacter alkaliphilus]NYG36766.1 cyclophilin family peptidyl-prolyl cis-trans isomerase [Janibacter alkaliphilus]
MSTRRAAPFAVALLAGVALAGCGTDSTSPASGSGGSSQAGSGSGSSSSSDSCPPEDGSAERRTSFDEAPPMCIDTAKTYTATMTTDEGEVTIALDDEAAPQTVNNFVVLCRYHFYDGLTFHRVIQGFMAQGGDPAGTGAGGPGYNFADELPDEGYEVGSVAMANAGPNTNGSQFFIVLGDDAAEQLDPSYSLFGEVTGGMDALQAIEKDGSDGEGRPSEVHTIEKVTITES